MVSGFVLGPSECFDGCCGPQMYYYGYMGRLRTDYRDCFGGYRGRLHENHLVGLKLYEMRTLKMLCGKQG